MQRIQTITGISRSLTVDILAHEFGHGSAIATDSVKYYNAIVPVHNCQDPANKNHPLSKRALEWQARYNRLYKEYKKKKK